MNRGQKIVIAVTGALVALVIVATVVIYAWAAAGEARVQRCRELVGGPEITCEDVR